MKDTREISEEITAIILKLVPIDTAQFDTTSSLGSLGVDSVKASMIKLEIEKLYNVVIPYELLISGPSVDVITDFIYLNEADNTDEDDSDIETFSF